MTKPAKAEPAANHALGVGKDFASEPARLKRRRHRHHADVPGVAAIFDARASNELPIRERHAHARQGPANDRTNFLGIRALAVQQIRFGRPPRAARVPTKRALDERDERINIGASGIPKHQRA